MKTIEELLEHIKNGSTLVWDCPDFDDEDDQDYTISNFEDLTDLTPELIKQYEDGSLGIDVSYDNGFNDGVAYLSEIRFIKTIDDDAPKCFWCKKPATINDYRSLDGTISKIASCGECSTLSTEYLINEYGTY